MKEKNRKAIETAIEKMEELLEKIEDLNKANSKASVAIEDESKEGIDGFNEDSRIWDSLTDIGFAMDGVPEKLRRFIDKYK